MNNKKLDIRVQYITLYNTICLNCYIFGCIATCVNLLFLLKIYFQAREKYDNKFKIEKK